MTWIQQIEIIGYRKMKIEIKEGNRQLNSIRKWTWTWKCQEQIKVIEIIHQRLGDGNGHGSRNGKNNLK